MNSLEIKPIAYILTDFKEKFGIPRQSGRVTTKGKIVFLPEYRNDDALRGIEEFSHLWLLFDFSESHCEKWSPTVRPPRLGGNKRVGVFATRSPFRPNPIGLSSVKLLKVTKEDGLGTVLIVEGADLLNQTPIFDIKPYLSFTDAHMDARNGYADAFREYALEVIFPDDLLKCITEEKREVIIQCLKEDPRPSYHNDDRTYGMVFGEYEIKFTVHDKTLTVTEVDRRQENEVTKKVL